MSVHDKKKKGRLKKAVKETVKKGIKKGVKYVKSAAAGELAGAVKSEIRSRSRKQGRKYAKKSERVGIPRELQPDITLGKKIKLKDRKTARQKKKIKKWQAEAAAGKKSEQQKFLELDKKFNK